MNDHEAPSAEKGALVVCETCRDDGAPCAACDGPSTTNGLTVRTTSTGINVIEGDCPHCGHPAMDHWSDGCKGARGGADHCRMDPWKLERIARVIPPGECAP